MIGSSRMRVTHRAFSSAHRMWCVGFCFCRSETGNVLVVGVGASCFDNRDNGSKFLQELETRI